MTPKDKNQEANGANADGVEKNNGGSSIEGGDNSLKHAQVDLDSNTAAGAGNTIQALVMRKKNCTQTVPMANTHGPTPTTIVRSTDPLKLPITIVDKILKLVFDPQARTFIEPEMDGAATYIYSRTTLNFDCMALAQTFIRTISPRAVAVMREIEIHFDPNWAMKLEICAKKFPRYFNAINSVLKRLKSLVLCGIGPKDAGERWEYADLRRLLLVKRLMPALTSVRHYVYRGVPYIVLAVEQWNISSGEVKVDVAAHYAACLKARDATAKAIRVACRKATQGARHAKQAGR